MLPFYDEFQLILQILYIFNKERKKQCTLSYCIVTDCLKAAVIMKLFSIDCVIHFIKFAFYIVTSIARCTHGL